MPHAGHEAVIKLSTFFCRNANSVIYNVDMGKSFRPLKVKSAENQQLFGAPPHVKRSCS